MAPSFVLVVGALSCGKAAPGGDETGEAGVDSVQAGSAGNTTSGTGGAFAIGGNMGTGGSNPPPPACPAPAPPPADGASCAVWIVTRYTCTFDAECGPVVGSCAGGQWDMPACGGGAGGEAGTGGQGGAAL